VDEAVERGEEGDAGWQRPVVGVVMADQPPLVELHAECAKALLLQGFPCFGQRHRLRLRVPALGEIPQTLATTATGDGDVAAAVQERQHPGQLGARPPPDVALARARLRMLELPRE
jgi:hypothetical protein